MIIFALLLAAFAQDAEMGRRVQDLLHSQQADVFGCVRSSSQSANGEMLVRVVVGANNKAARADVLKDQAGAPAIAPCVQQKIKTWDLTSLQAAPGDQVVFPLVFRPEHRHIAHRTQHKPANDQSTTHAQVLIDEETMGEKPRASLTLIELSKGAKWTMHEHMVGEAFYVLDGAIEIVGAGGPVRATKGDAVWLPPNAPHEISSDGAALVLQVFAPSGPERIHRDPKATGTITVNGKPRKIEPVVRHARDAKSYAIAGGKGRAQLLLDGTGAGIAIDLITADAGMQVPAHKHELSDELVYVLDGKGKTAVANDKFDVGKGDAVHMPTGFEHSLAVDEKMTIVQIYAPAGPEQRFKGQPK